MDPFHPSLRLLGLGATLMLGACAVQEPYGRAPPSRQPPQASPSQPLPPPSLPSPQTPRPAHLNRLAPATRSLVTQARAQLARGDLPAASSTLDRALRIEPANPLLWIELGRLRLAESDARQAESCARKAMALASGDRAAQAQSGQLLTDALRAQQRNQEAQKVEKRQ